MELTYILVDFENVQPHDLGLLQGEQYRVKVFHGPHQTKLDIGIVRALQPLGASVEYVQRDKAGKNALDFLMAFCIGRLVEEHQTRAMPARDRVRFVVISKDGGFESLLGHVRSLGFAANQAATIREGLAVEGPSDEHQSPPPPAKGPVAAAKVEPKKAAPKVKAAKPAKATKAASGKETDPVALEKVIAHLRDHAKGRPTKRDALERHVATILGGKVAPDSVCSLVADLERAGVVDISDKQVTYKLPKVKK